MLHSADDRVATTPDPPEPTAVSPTAESRVDRLGEPGRRVLRLVAESMLVGTAGCVIAALVARWDPALWRVYFNYRADTFFNAMNGALANPLGITDTTTRVGWPYGLDMTDFPAGEPIFTWFQWLAHRFVDDDFTVLAAVWFVGFGLVATTTYLVLRGLKLGRWPSVIAALVYDFVPFHLQRSIDHTNLALYMAVPIAGMVLLWVMSGRLDRPPRSSSLWRPLWRMPDWWVVAGGAFVIAVSARYYAVFFLLLIILVGVGRAVIQQRVGLVRAPALIVAATLGLALLTGLPQIVQVAGNGRNSEVANRSRTESDLYALRLTELVAPVPDHRIGALADLSDTLRRSITRGEDNNSMGVFLLAGLTFAGAVTLLRRPRRLSDDHEVDDPVGLATHTTVLAGLTFAFATVGGLSGVIASLGFTQIRAWNRFSIYISFCGAVGLALALSWLWTMRRSPVLWRRWLPVVVCPVVLVLAVLDQSGTWYPDQTPVATARDSDRDFFGSMADDLGAGSAVFQLPWVPFPESGSAELDYAGFRGFFNDRGLLNWSFGGMRGRESDWQRTWVTTDPETQVVGLAVAGFDAIVVDRAGYTPENDPEAILATLVGPAQRVSPDGRFAWFDLRPLSEALVREHGEEWVEQTGARVVRPIGVQFRAETYRTSGTGAQDWGTIGASTTVELGRYDDNTDPVSVALGVGVAAGSEVTVSSGSWRSTQTSAGQPVVFRHELSMQPERVSIDLSTDAPNVATTTESRSDVRGEIVELKVLDATLAQQIAGGELTIPTP